MNGTSYVLGVLSANFVIVRVNDHIFVFKNCWRFSFRTNSLPLAGAHRIRGRAPSERPKIIGVLLTFRDMHLLSLDYLVFVIKNGLRALKSIHPFVFALVSPQELEIFFPVILIVADGLVIRLSTRGKVYPFPCKTAL